MIDAKVLKLVDKRSGLSKAINCGFRMQSQTNCKSQFMSGQSVLGK